MEREREVVQLDLSDIIPTLKGRGFGGLSRSRSYLFGGISAPLQHIDVCAKSRSAFVMDRLLNATLQLLVKESPEALAPGCILRGIGGRHEGLSPCMFHT